MRSRRRILIPIGLLVVIAAIYLGFRQQRGNNHGLLASGTVEATDALLGFQATGRIASINVREGDSVHADSVLAQLDRTEMQARRDQAAAQVEAANAVLSELKRGSRSEEVVQAEAALDATRQRREEAERDLARTQRLHEGGAVSQEVYDKAQVTLDVARSMESQAQQQLQLVRKGPREERIEAQHAQVVQADAALRVIDAQLENMLIRSAFDGVVTVRHHEPGEIVAMGVPVLTVMNLEDRWVRIYVREDRIGAVHLDQGAAISCDTYPGRSFRGRVIFIASQAEFTPKNVQSAEERVRLVYAVKVRIEDDPEDVLKPGLPVDVRLDVGS